MFLLLAAVPAPPQQQTPTVIERVLVTATAAPASERALGRGVTVLTREDIEQFAGGVLADVLRLAPGVDVRARGEKGVQADFVLRGASFGQALVLVDGLRLNDAQSGHHNADFPVPAASIDRIEVVTGAASSAHGADAFGGAIHIVTRSDRYREVTAAGGSFEAFRGEGAYGTAGGYSAAAWGSRSGGFMFDRDHAMGGVRLAAAPARGLRLSASHARKAFGANGFYGPSPSKEWTDLTMAAASFSRAGSAWSIDARAAYRHHGDHFRWDIARPGFAENRHRTNAVDAIARAGRTFGRGGRVTFGGSAGGDWIASSNLGDHTQGRGSAFAEVQLPVSSRLVLQPAVRLDAYSTFGAAVSPSLAVSGWTDAGLRLRASAGRAFRAPTYTERYYSDPNHRATATLDPEDGWTLDGGADWRRAGWSASATIFRRWDRNVIDWVRASAAERWQTTNVHDVDTHGVEVTIARELARGTGRVTYAWVDSSAPRLTLLSKYVLDYTRHAVGAQAAWELPAQFALSARADHRRRSDRQRYTLVDARLSKRAGRATLFVEGSNLLDETYTEIAGVAMPGRAAMAGVTIR
jgi:iron complex outermembrane receptor protein